MAQYRWYRDGHVIVKSWDMERRYISDITPEYYDDYIGNQKHYKGDLDLNQTDVTSLGNLKHVGGRLGLVSINLTSLGNLETVGGNIYCTRGSSTYDLLKNSRFKDQIRLV